MGIVPEPRSILDLITDWGAPLVCMSTSCTPLLAPPGSGAADYGIPERWVLPEDSLSDSDKLCTSCAIASVSPQRRGEMGAGLLLTSEVRQRLALDHLARFALCRDQRAPSPITLTGTVLKQVGPCTISGFVVRGFSHWPADKLVSLGASLTPPLFLARHAIGDFNSTVVDVCLAFAVSHLDAPTSPLISHWRWQDPYGAFKLVQEELEALSAAQVREVRKAWNAFLRRPNLGGAPKLDAADYDNRLIKLAEKYLRSHPGGRVSRVQFCAALDVREGSIKDWVRRSTFADWAAFRQRHLNARTVRYMAHSNG